MKKRGHKADAHTYTIMLRGFTMNHKQPKAVEEAMKVYDSMWRPECNIKPSIIHSNAIINCLGRALNMDALWSVAGRLPDRGPGAADKWTYTTILNTMQACAVRDARQLAETDGDQEAAAKVIQSAINEGRKLWEDVVSRWRSGDVNIDQTLVCAMGRLLLLGQKYDWDDIFSLVEQTMRLPRLQPPFIRQVVENGGELDLARTLPAPNEGGESSGLDQLEMAVGNEAAPKVKNEFAVVDLSDRQVRARGGADVPSPYANVGNNVLSLLIEAAIKLREIPTGKMYWEKLTNPENEPFVMPDDENLHSYLRLLRISRSSKAICDLLRQPVNGGLEGIWYRRGTFVIAMSTCARDFKNPNVFTYASNILDLMQAKLDKADLKVMTMYLSLAMVTTPGVSTEIHGEFNARPGENNLIRAVQRFNYSDLDYRLIVSKWSEGHEKKYEEEELYVGHKRKGKVRNRFEDSTPPPAPEDLLEFMQTLNSAYDKLLSHRLKMTEMMATAFTCQKRELSQALQQINPEALPPSRAELERTEPADTLPDDDRLLKGKRYPEKIARSGERNVKGPRVVDLDKRHPFLRDREEGDRRERRSSRGSESWKDKRDDRRPQRKSNASMSWKGDGEDRRPESDSRSSPSWSNNGEDRQPRRGSRSSDSWGSSRGDRRPDRGSRSSPSWNNIRDDQRSARNPESSTPSNGWNKAWKQSVENMGKDEEGRKEWVVV